MIDTASFLNSKDIADYWYKIGYNSCCTPPESAFVIWNNRTKIMVEKMTAWRRLIAETIDCPIASKEQCLRMGLPDALTGSLHEFLKAYIRLLQKLVGTFYRDGDKAVYSYRVCYEGDSDWYEGRLLYSEAKECFAAVNAEEDLIPSIVGVQIKKQWIGENKQITLTTQADRTVLDVDADGLEEADMNLLQAFEWMWFAFPTPFKRGDIVVSKYTPFGWNLFTEEPFVLINLCSWGSEDYKTNGIPEEMGCYKTADRRIARYKECGDGSDMTAHGCFQNEDGSIYYECMHCYLDLEYYRKEPKGIRRILKAVSSFEKGELGSDLFAIAYHTLMDEERVKREKEQLSCFTDEGLRLAGLK